MSPTEKRNLKRIFVLFIYPLVFLLRIIPRNKKLWIFGNFKGYSDNTKYVFEHIHHQNDYNIKAYWVTKDKNIYNRLKNENKNVLYLYSFNGIWKSYRAGVCFLTNGYSDLNKLATLDSFIVQLWHGLPIKKIMFDADLETRINSLGTANNILTHLSKYSMKILNNKINLFFVSSPFELDRMSRAFKVKKEKFRITGAPRYDIIKDSATNVKAKNIFKKYNKTEGKVILYAPSWREEGWSKNQILKEPYKLQHFLEKENVYFFIKPHPLTKIKEIEDWGIHESKRIIFLDYFDINEAYGFTDLVITDFSSLIFDYAILGRPILIFISDLHIYSNNRGFYDDINLLIENRIFQNWDSLIDYLETEFPTKLNIHHPHIEYILNNSSNQIRKKIVENVILEMNND